MPYTAKNMPAATKKLPTHQRKIFRSAFNSAYAEYNGDEQKAFATAWAAVNKAKGAKDHQSWSEFMDQMRAVHPLDAYIEHQPREKLGKWTTGSGGGDTRKPHEISRYGVERAAAKRKRLNSTLNKRSP